MNCIVIGNGPASRALPGFIAGLNGLTLIASYTHARDLQNEPEMLEAAKLLFVEPGTAWENEKEMMTNLCIGKTLIVAAATPQHAVEAFELGATDYLLYPFLLPRFAKACEKARNAFSAPLASNGSDYFFVKTESRFERINRSEILYIESLQNYIVIQTSTKKVITYSSLKSIESYLSKEDFLRVQRSFIISLAKVEQVSSEDVVIGTTSIPISRGIRDTVLRIILQNRLYQFQC